MSIINESNPEVILQRVYNRLIFKWLDAFQLGETRPFEDACETVQLLSNSIVVHENCVINGQSFRVVTCSN